MTRLSEQIEKLSPLERAAFALKQTQAKLDAIERARSEPIAIVGVACRFPGGADDPASFWRLLSEGTDAITEVPRERWDVDAYYDEDPKAPGKTNSRWGGFLERVDGFDNHFFGVSDREAAQIDPQQRLLMELCWEALEDAGLPPDRLRGSRTGVFVGISASDYGMMLSGDLANTGAHIATGTSLSIAANRLSFAFDFCGPSVAMDTACSSSLVAVHMACQSLRSGESQVALVGGVNMILTPVGSVNLTKAGFSAPDGRCRAFDAKAGGYVRGEGGGIVVLKPLSTARADGDPIYALIRGSAVNQNGRSNGLTAPNRQAQEAVLREAYARAKVAPGQIQYVEAQGTGTPLGDTIEALALGNVLAEGRPDGRHCVLGAVKTNIGHLEAASGIAGLIKVALSMRHRQFPPTVHFQSPNPNVPFDRLPLRVRRALSPWPNGAGPRMAGVSAFGFGGSNAHVVLEEAPPPAAAPSAEVIGRGRPAIREEMRIPSRWLGGAFGCPTDGRACLLPLSARNPKALKALAQSYRELLCGDPPALHEISHTAAARREHHDHRLALVVGSHGEAIDLLDAFARDEARPGLVSGSKPYGRRPKLAFLFAGDAAAWRTAGRELRDREGVFRASLEQWDGRLRRTAGWSIAELLETERLDEPGRAKLDEPGRAKLDEPRWDDPAFAQPALLALQMSWVALWRSLGIVPDAVLGVGPGELAAACVAEILTPEDALRVSVHRGLRRNGVSVEPPTVGPRAASIPLISAVDGQVREAGDLNIEHWASCLGEPADVSAALEALGDRLPDALLEMGPASPIEPISQGLGTGHTRCRVLASLSSNGSRRNCVLDTLAALYTLGHGIDWSGLHASGTGCVRLPSYPWQRKRFWIETKRTYTPADVSERGEARSKAADVSGNGASRRGTQPDAIGPGEPSEVIRPRPELNAPYEPPRTDLEREMADLWAKTLKIDRVGIHDNFFELGGDSLQGAVLINRLQEQLTEVVHAIALFEAQTINDLADYLRKEYPAAVKGVFPSEEVGDAADADVDPQWPETIGPAEVEQARAMIADLVPRKPARPIIGGKNRRAVFVLSPPRSGSTLFRIMLAGHPKLFAPPELELLPFDTLGDRRRAYPEMARSFLEGADRALMEIHRCSSQEAAERMRQYEQQQMPTQDFYRLLQESIGPRTLVDKTPGYAANPEALKRAEIMFEEALYIHLLRHPCGMIRSFVDYKMDQTYTHRYSVQRKSPFSPQQMGELVWIMSQQNIFDFLEHVPARRQHRLKFEDLVTQPESTLADLCRFLELDYHPDMARPYEEKEKKMTDGVKAATRMHGDQKFLVVHKSIDPSVADRWKEDMTGDFLGPPAREIAATLGYEDVAPPAAKRHGNGSAPARMQIPRLARDDDAERLLGQIDQLSDAAVESLLSQALAD